MISIIGLPFAPETIPYPVKHKPKVPFRPVVIPPADFDQVTARIVELDRGLDRFYLSAPDYGALVEEATAANVHWSTKIEGNPSHPGSGGGTSGITRTPGMAAILGCTSLAKAT